MKTLQEIKDQVAQDREFEDWDTAMQADRWDGFKEILFEEAAKRYAAAMIEEDRKDCAEGADLAKFFPGDTEAVSISSILNRPLPELK